MNKVFPASRNQGEEEIFSCVCKTLSYHSMIQKGDTVILGVSGGMDSMCLLDLFHRIMNRDHLQLVVAHLNHGLRGEEAEEDYRFVEKQASQYGVPFVGKRLTKNSYASASNKQERARELRYTFYEEVAGKWNAQKIATGHHRDDQVETLLIQIFRGTGTLKGIVPVREGRYIRPLLDVAKQDIFLYAMQRKIAYREDSSNENMTYLRNRIRHSLVPWIRREINPSYSSALLHLSSILREEHESMNVFGMEAFNEVRDRTPSIGEVVLDRNILETLQPAIQKRVLRKAFQEIAGSTRGLSYAHVHRICEFLQSKERGKNRKFSLPQGIRLFLEYEKILLSRQDLWTCASYRYPLSLGKDLYIPEADVCIRSERIPCEKVTAHDPMDHQKTFLDPGDVSSGMILRNIRSGDRFQPLGLHGTKKLKRFFIDRKIPRSIRCRVPILEIDGKIAWVVGQGMDERFKVNKTDGTCIQLEMRGEGEWFG